MSLKKKVYAEARKHAKACEDYFYLCVDSDDYEGGIEISNLIEKRIKKGDPETVELWEIHRKVLRWLAPKDFHSFLLFTEWERDPKKKFYVPRREQLEPLVRKMQDLADDKLDILAISMPPGVGKTTLGLFYLVWLSGREPNLPNIMGSHSNSFLHGAYEECLRLINSDEYNFKECFDVKVTRTNAKDMRIDLDVPSRFETIEFASIGSGNAGKLRAQNLLYCDDLVPDLETAMSIDRLDKLWKQYTTDLRQRKLGDRTKELHIATRWSVHDPIGRLEEAYRDDPRACFVTCSALDENDQSNFDYPFGLGYTTDVLRTQREIMDEVEWRCLYQNEPIEREGRLYVEDELRYYFTLPSEEPDAIISICDSKDRGDDYCFLPVAYQYGDDYYIEDCICDNGKPEIVDERCVSILIKHKVKNCRYESNAGGGKTAEKISERIKREGGITNITTKYTTANKETKIVHSSPWVKSHCLFKSEYKKNDDYGRMMSFLFSYNMSGRNKHDDVPDGMAMLSDYAQGFSGARMEIIRRLF